MKGRIYSLEVMGYHNELHPTISESGDRIILPEDCPFLLGNWWDAIAHKNMESLQDSLPAVLHRIVFYFSGHSFL